MAEKKKGVAKGKKEGKGGTQLAVLINRLIAAFHGSRTLEKLARSVPPTFRVAGHSSAFALRMLDAREKRSELSVTSFALFRLALAVSLNA